MKSKQSMAVLLRCEGKERVQAAEAARISVGQARERQELHTRGSPEVCAGDLRGPERTRAG